MKTGESAHSNIWGNMKTIAILLVVLGHVTRMYTMSGAIDTGSSPTVFKIITALIYSFHMPAFFAVSGAVYFINKVERHKYNNQWSFIVSKSRRLMIPYFFFAFIVVFPTMWHIGFVTNPFKYIVDSYLLSYDPRHLWFLLVLFEIFVIFNLFHSWIINHRIITLIILLAFQGVSTYLPSLFQISELFAFFVYFYVGYLFASISKKVDLFISQRGWWSCLFIMSVFWLLCYFLVWTFHESIFVYRPLVLITALAGTLLLYIICHLGGAILSKNRLLQIVSINSFGLYLFHPMIIYLAFYHFNSYWDAYFLMTVSVFLIVTLVSILLTIFVRKIGFGFIVGEYSK